MTLQSLTFQKLSPVDTIYLEIVIKYINVMIHVLT